MGDSRKIIKVFLASPGDLQDERRAAKAVVEEFNKLWADNLGYHVELGSELIKSAAQPRQS
jgi:hypothetical protein